MAIYRISGVWKNEENVITHYAFHTVHEKTASRSVKTSKVEAIRLLDAVEIMLLHGCGIISTRDGKLEKTWKL